MMKVIAATAVLILGTVLYLRFPSQQESVSPPLWGAFAGSTVEEAEEFERKVGAPMQLRGVFVHWGNEREFPLALAPSLQGKTLVIYWEATDYNVEGVDQPNFSYDAILRGDWDTYVRTFAEQAKLYGGPVILIPFEEMNSDWYTWSGAANGNTPTDHIAAYRYLRDFFRDVPNVQFGWAVNHESVPDTPENSIAAYYPGDEYVDIVGVDGFNFDDPWQTFEEVFGSALDQLRVYEKPIFIFSMASAEGPGKAEWIRDAFTVQLPRHPEVRGWIWFNENKEKDWRVDSDPNSLKAFQEAVR